MGLSPPPPPAVAEAVLGEVVVAVEMAEVMVMGCVESCCPLLVYVHVYEEGAV